jgi:hypothetical protein
LILYSKFYNSPSTLLRRSLPSQFTPTEPMLTETPRGLSQYKVRPRDSTIRQSAQNDRNSEVVRTFLKSFKILHSLPTDFVDMESNSKYTRLTRRFNPRWLIDGESPSQLDVCEPTGSKTGDLNHLWSLRRGRVEKQYIWYVQRSQRWARKNLNFFLAYDKKKIWNVQMGQRWARKNLNFFPSLR